MIRAAFNHALGNELRRLRNELGWPRPELCRRVANLPVTTYQTYEEGRRLCPLPRLVDICTALRVNPGAVVNTAVQNTEPVSPPLPVDADSRRFGCAIVVFMDADGVDGRDANRVAEGAVRQALAMPLTTYTWDGVLRTAVVRRIGEINAVLADGSFHVVRSEYARETRSEAAE